MKRSMILIAAALLTAGCSGDDKKDARVVERNKESVVELDDLKAKPPAKWVEETPSSAMGPQFAPLYQFRLPRVGDDPADAEVRISRGIGGSLEANLNRWKGQFEPPAGKKIDDVAKVSEIKIGGRPASMLDVSGTFLGAPGMKGSFPNYRMIGISFDGPRRPYHIILRGPAATVAEYQEGFDEWLKEFK